MEKSGELWFLRAKACITISPTRGVELQAAALGRNEGTYSIQNGTVTTTRPECLRICFDGDSQHNETFTGAQALLPYLITGIRLPRVYLPDGEETRRWRRRLFASGLAI